MFRKILVANRGEIACRVIRSARKMGIATVAVYSDADRDALHVALADEAVHIGAAPPKESYLNAARIVEAGRQTGAEAVHPGYGFLSENANFASLCSERGIVFIGPPVAAIEAMGSKSAAKDIMGRAGVPLIPGYHGNDQSEARLRAAAEEIGYPVLLKAVAGGGGKGMRLVLAAADFADALASARREAASAFGDDAMLVERFLQRPRHVEMQIFCDRQGNGVYLFERDCSVQRRHQKVIEEAPAPHMSAQLRERMGQVAVQAARAIAYEGAGTVEFLLDGSGAFYFMEMNTRLQVEHPVTEMITGQDLVEWQLRVAAGEPLPLAQGDVQLRGHSFEARIYAEDPAREFLPATGTLSFLQPPTEGPNVRVDSGVLQGDEVSVWYDPMIAKLVTWDESRDKALARLAAALAEFRVGGVATNLGFLYNLATCAPFRAAEIDTGFIERHRELLFRDSEGDRLQNLPLASLYLLLRMEQASRARARNTDPWSPWNASTAWRLNQQAIHRGAIEVNGVAYEVPVVEVGSHGRRRFQITACGRSVLATGELTGNELHADIDGYRRRVTVVAHDGRFTLFGPHGALEFALVLPDIGDDSGHAAADAFLAPMPGVIVKHLVEPGARVSRGQPLLIMEAMKMEHRICAPADGVLQSFYFEPGQQVAGGDELLAFHGHGADGSPGAG